MPGFARSQGPGGGAGGGQGRGLGPGGGRRGGGFGGGPGGFCVCPACGQKAPHQRGVPCFEVKCPHCGTMMTRQER
jgi:electron transport complex protein RnfB